MDRYNGYGYEPPYDAYRQGKNDANSLGAVMLTLGATSQYVYSAVVFVLTIAGVLSRNQLKADCFGLPNELFLLLYAVIYTLMFLIPIVLAVLIMGKQPRFCLSHREYTPSDAFFGVLAAMGLCLVANSIASYWESFLRSVGLYSGEFPDYLENTPTSLIVNIVVFAVLPALLEETLFRGCVLRMLLPRGELVALVVSSALFGLMHGDAVQVVFAFISGIGFGWLTIKTGNPALSMAVHFANNALSLLLNYASFSFDQSAMNFGYTLIVSALLTAGAISVFVLIFRHSSLWKRFAPSVSGNGKQDWKTVFSAPVFLLSLLMFAYLVVKEF